MVGKYRRCPKCGTAVETYINPIPAVDVIIGFKNSDDKDGIILIYRKNEPHKWALPGGYVEYGETLEDAAKREAEEETSLVITILRQFHAYSDPERDPRHHIISTVYIASATGVPSANDDAQDVGIFSKDSLPSDIAFDHKKIITDYYEKKY